jgi:hypothetical protein
MMFIGVIHIAALLNKLGGWGFTDGAYFRCRIAFMNITANRANKFLHNLTTS